MREEQQVRQWLQAVQAGRLSRRDFLARLVASGVPVALAAQALGTAGAAHAGPSPGAYKPTRRGGGGTLRLLFWQGPTLLNPHFANGVKDIEGSRLFYEPLAVYDSEGTLRPLLAAEIPSRENGGLAADGRSVTWKLKRGVTWHDGAPFTADDVVFNWQYAVDPNNGTFSSGQYRDLRMEKVDSHTVRVLHEQPTPFLPNYAVVKLIPKHLFAPYMGAKSREAPYNLRPVGTGPYRFAEFKPGDHVRGVLNPTYHLPNRPYFDAFELKGGGDSTSAARAVLQTGEFDYAWGLLMEDEVLRRMEAGSKGRVETEVGGGIEHLFLNVADPWTEVEGERAHPKSRHPLFSDPAVRQAVGHLIDRKSLQEFVFGRNGVATGNFINQRPTMRSQRPIPEFSVDKANAVLEAAGWKRGGDGIRAKEGRRLKVVYQTSGNAIRQKAQALLKRDFGRAGFEVELKVVPPEVFFSSDVSNPDTLGKFWADLQMYANSGGPPDPTLLLMQFTSEQIASKANKWNLRNVLRWRNDEFDRTHKAMQSELDPVKRAAMVIRLNDLVCNDGYVHPMVSRTQLSAMATALVAPTTPWGDSLSWLQDWYREG